jgi:predicted small metal-binding protein
MVEEGKRRMFKCGDVDDTAVMNEWSKMFRCGDIGNDERVKL